MKVKFFSEDCVVFRALMPFVVCSKKKERKEKEIGLEEMSHDQYFSVVVSYTGKRCLVQLHVESTYPPRMDHPIKS